MDFDRRERDFYPTPRAAVLPLIPHLRAARIRTFCEPCAGDGALVRHLESFGLVCTHASDIATGTDARDIPSFDSPVVTNPPYERKLMHALIRHFIATAPCCVAAARIRLDRHQAGAPLPASLLRYRHGRTPALDRRLAVHRARQLRVAALQRRSSRRSDPARGRFNAGAHAHLSLRRRLPTGTL